MVAHHGRLAVCRLLFNNRNTCQRKGEQFDLVASLEVIEHVDDPAGFVSSLAGLTRPGGMLTLSTINRTPKVGWSKTLYSVLLLQFSNKFVLESVRAFCLSVASSSAHLFLALCFFLLCTAVRQSCECFGYSSVVVCAVRVVFLTLKRYPNLLKHTPSLLFCMREGLAELPSLCGCVFS